MIRSIKILVSDKVKIVASSLLHSVSLRINRKSNHPKHSKSGPGFRNVYGVGKKW
jgi:hypothetical protein